VITVVFGEIANPVVDPMSALRMAVSLKQRKTPSARHAFLLRKDFHDAAKYEWQHSWKRGSRTDCCLCLRYGTDKIQHQILFSAGHIGQILDMSWTYSNV
jgi:hypothetical protein